MGLRIDIAVAAAVLAFAARPTKGFSSFEADGQWREPVHVEVGPKGDVYVGGTRVDTLVVYRNQLTCWARKDPSSPGITILFDRKLFHPRHPMRFTLGPDMRDRCRWVDRNARLRLYSGTIERGVPADAGRSHLIWIRVAPPPVVRGT